MKCRVKTQFVISSINLLQLFVFRMSFAFVISFCVVHHHIRAQFDYNTNEKHKTIEADHEFISSYPSWIFSIFNHLDKWSPTDQFSEECKLSFSSPELHPEKCKLHLKLNYFEQFRSKLFFNFDISDHSRFQPFSDELNDFQKIRGLLALHDGNARPLVIFRMGIHGNRDEVLAERFLLRIIYQDLGLNVLMLENLTSHAYLLQNPKLSIGGMEEGLHTFFVLNKIKNNRYSWSKQISDIHLLGISLGGQGVFLTTMLDEQSQHFIKSSQVFCPLINFRETFDLLKPPSIFNAFVDIWNWRRLIAIQNRIPDYNPWSEYKILLDLQPQFTPLAMNWLDRQVSKPILSTTEFEKQFPKVKFSNEFRNFISESKSLFQLNNFWPIYKNEKTPFQIVATPNDPLVNNGINSDRIKNGKQPGDFSKTSFLELQGIHCALAAEYEWPFLVEVVRRGLQIK
jgi:hypothetical protein